MSPVIEVNHVTKEYRLGTLASMKDMLITQYRRLRGETVEEKQPFKALNDINFKVEAGEVLGIIGHNGAGKSTILKILAGIVTPTHGSIVVKGKVAPLIEVGAGLVPDMTGRENIYLNATILGMKRKEIDKKFDEIVEFAELEEFIDTPIKRYSSGMQIKLGFAIATSVDSNILIVDEVLAVGDIAFQRKCFDRMEELIKGQGKTVLLVSHNIRQVARMCSRVIQISHGLIVNDGPPDKVCDAYYAENNRIIAREQKSVFDKGHNILSSGELDLVELDLLDKDGKVTQELSNGESCGIRCVFEAHEDLEDIEIVVGFHTTDFIYIASMGTAIINSKIDFKKGVNVVECNIINLPLEPGSYAIRVGVFDKLLTKIFYGETLSVFSVISSGGSISKIALHGLVTIPASWNFH